MKDVFYAVKGLKGGPAILDVEDEAVNETGDNIAYVDGSFNEKTGTYGYGGFLVAHSVARDDQTTERPSGILPEKSTAPVQP